MFGAENFERLLQMQRENSEEQLKFNTLKGRKESFDKLREGLQEIPKAEMIPGGAAGFGMPRTGSDQFFQEYMNKKMQEDAQRRAIEMQETQATPRMIMDTRRMFPQMGAIPGSMY